MVLAESQLPGLDAIVREIAEIRPLAGVASAVLRITDGDRFSAHELGKVIATDQALSAKVLRLSNSAYYGFPRRIGTTRDAIVLIGFRAVRSAVLASCVIESVGESDVIDYREFWRYSVSVGVLAEIAAQSENGPAEEAFTAGVLHNIGRLVLAQHMPKQFRQCLRRAARDGASLHEAERAMFGFTDAELGGALALHWNFPEALAQSVLHHPLNVYTVPDEEASLTSYVVRGRAFIRAYGLSDGVEVSQARSTPAEWTRPPLSTALLRAGGADGVLDRVQAFLDSTAAG
ncbi:MAG: HDOD domain-containing protein [Dehalococcoidia bacterium]